MSENKITDKIRKKVLEEELALLWVTYAKEIVMFGKTHVDTMFIYDHTITWLEERISEL